MKNKLFRVIAALFVLFCLVGASWADSDMPYPIMKPDRETFLRWVQAHENAPRAPFDAVLAASMPPQGSLSLLSYISYVPSERNQGSCGNCWAWAGTGVMEIDLYRQKSIKNRLSVQLLNSCDTPYACCGGMLDDFAGFYTSKDYAIPWANTNAQWQDGGRTCSSGSSTRSCSSIDITTQYPMTTITAQGITTYGAGQATAIANIKNVLAQNKGVAFAFWLATTADWNSFNSFWSSSNESVVWNPDTFCGHTTNAGYGGHEVLIVGYNDDDPNNKYWIVLNSWGTNANRPNGLFRVKMNMNYDCTHIDAGHTYMSNYFETLGITWGDISIEWETAYQTLFNSPADLFILRNYRDNFLGKSLQGKVLTRLLYKNSDEALMVLISNPELMDQAALIVQENIGAIAEASAGGEGVIANTDAILSFLDAFALKSPPSLKRFTENVRNQMMKKKGSGEPFFGLRLQ